MLFRRVYLTALFVFASLCSFSQNRTIIGDTIWVSADNSPKLRFESSSFRRHNTSCEKNNPSYLISAIDNELTVSAGLDNPVSPCVMFVDEGNEDNTKVIRAHQFVLIFVNGNIQLDQLLHDYSSQDKIKECMDRLEASKKAAKKTVQSTNSAMPAAPAQQSAEVSSNVVYSGPQTTPLKIEADKSDANALSIDGLTITKAEFEISLNSVLSMFSRNLHILCQQRDRDPDYVIKKTMTLFNNNDSVLVDVASNNTRRKCSTKHIRHYLEAVSTLNYSDVKYKYGEKQFIGGLTKQTDGSYMGTMVCVQDFQGFREGRLVVHNKQQKTFNVRVVVFDEVRNGITTKRWQVYLGNILVDETMKA